MTNAVTQVSPQERETINAALHDLWAMQGPEPDYCSDWNAAMGLFKHLVRMMPAERWRLTYLTGHQVTAEFGWPDVFAHIEPIHIAKACLQLGRETGR